MSLSLDKMWAIRNAHEEKYGQYCDNGDFEMVAQEIADAAVKEDREARQKWIDAGLLVSKAAVPEDARSAFRELVAEGHQVEWESFEYGFDLGKESLTRNGLSLVPMVETRDMQSAAVPERMARDLAVDIGYADGWNDCIDEMMAKQNA